MINLEDTISINHNWGNGCNLDLFWNFLKEELTNVENEISDLRSECDEFEFLEKCQLILRANSGIDYEGFYSYLKLMAEKQMDVLAGEGSGMHLARYHLKQISSVLESFWQDPQLQGLMELGKVDKNFLTTFHQRLNL